MSQPPDKPGEPAAPSFDLDLFLQNQVREIELRHEEIDLRRQESRQSFEYANKALEAQLEDRGRDRAIAYKGQRDARILVAALTLLLVVFLGVALLLDKDQIALEIVKVIGLLFAGGISGYALGRQQAKADGGHSPQEKPPAS